MCKIAWKGMREKCKIEKEKKKKFTGDTNAQHEKVSDYAKEKK